MKRYHLFEFEDLAWLPGNWRRYLTELLAYQMGTTPLYDAVLPLLIKLIRLTNCKDIVDCASGAGGPWPHLWPQLTAAVDQELTLTLTDRYPVHINRGLDINYDQRTVDASQPLPPDLKGCRTFFTSFHHFKPLVARRVLQHVVHAQQPIAIFEFTARDKRYLRGMLRSPQTVWRDTAQLDSPTIDRWLWTYLLPVIPLIYWWDGTISHLRTYAPPELLQLTENLSGRPFDWQSGTLAPAPGSPYPITYLIGYPKARPSAG